MTLGFFLFNISLNVTIVFHSETGATKQEMGEMGSTLKGEEEEERG